ncbi:MAG TPA: aminoacetone oxidase family FAD-binding enzyme [Candidatus Onthomorpha intestinigallinarum]|uniref:Aminoacetone oxidase family FAD-binding enzyme n=1 Tax=Candidatus Onthomorpha intestinigallinarum TaxID=2840880 RepID=A0A9D1RJX6_9BACT|nr:aminoacetone oxidase family FAD-binding enzyme [Candidatus Onthomorpha intestinigallinarum]
MRQRNKYDVIIVGAGASGLMAAAQMQQYDLKILVLEKMQQAGLKLRITGKGRCNLTNTMPIDIFLTHCHNGAMLIPSIKNFSNQDTVTFFEHLGVELQEERGHRIFPKSGKSLDVFLALMHVLEKNENTDIICRKTVTKLITDKVRITGVECQDEKIFANAVLLCCGGETYPNTGSNGDGIKLAHNAGHKITPTMPALVGLRTKNGHSKYAHNYLVKNVELSIMTSNGEILEKDCGDIILDEYGISGPITLKLNRKIAELINNEQYLKVKIDFKPKINEDRLKKEIDKILKERTGQNIENIMRAWLPMELIKDYKHWLKSCKGKTRLNDNILTYLKYNTDEIIGDMGWHEAIITHGGIDLRHVNCLTMESKHIKGLYFAGEILDFDGDTGGFNLQIAFSTAALAAKNIIKSLIR